MTFNENAIIPSKLISFYDHAFQTLLTWHDATKDSFERSRALSIDQFRLVFSTFCLISYYDSYYEFDESTLRAFINKSLAYHNIEINPDEVKLDFCESVNLVQKDGLKYVFVHRSFQEYFAAECAMRVVSGRAETFLDAFSKRLRDSVFQMCYEIHPELVYDLFLKKAIDDFRNFKNRVDPLRKAKYGYIGSVVRQIKLDVYGKGSMIGPVRIATTEENRHYIHLVDIFHTVFPIDETSNPAFTIYRFILSELSNLQDEVTSHSDERLILEIDFNATSISISARNAGAQKVEIKKINNYKRKVLALLRKNAGPMVVEVNGTLTRIDVFLNQMENERRQEVDSIDEILGLG